MLCLKTDTLNQIEKIAIFMHFPEEEARHYHCVDDVRDEHDATQSLREVYHVPLILRYLTAIGCTSKIARHYAHKVCIFECVLRIDSDDKKLKEYTSLDNCC